MRVDYLKNQQILHKSVPQKFWSTISSILPSKKGSSKIINLRDKDRGDAPTYVKQKEVAQTMNSYFSSIGPKLAEKHTLPWSYLGETEATQIDDIVTDSDEVILLCKEIENLKSSGINSRVYLIVHLGRAF